MMNSHAHENDDCRETPFDEETNPWSKHVSHAWPTPSGYPHLPFDIAVEILIQRKKIAGRFYFRPSVAAYPSLRSPLLTVDMVSVDPQHLLSGWRSHPVQVMTRFPRKEAEAMCLKDVPSQPIHQIAPPSPPDQHIRDLEQKIQFLQSQLHTQEPYLQLYRLGASGFFMSLVSLITWFLFGLGVPFHPIFAAVVIPASVGVMIMAFLVRPDKPPVRSQGKPDL